MGNIVLQFRKNLRIKDNPNVFPFMGSGGNEYRIVSSPTPLLHQLSIYLDIAVHDQISPGKYRDLAEGTGCFDGERRAVADTLSR